MLKFWNSLVEILKFQEYHHLVAILWCHQKLSPKVQTLNKIIFARQEHLPVITKEGLRAQEAGKSLICGIKSPKILSLNGGHLEADKELVTWPTAIIQKVANTQSNLNLLSNHQRNSVLLFKRLVPCPSAPEKDCELFVWSHLEAKLGWSNAQLQLYSTYEKSYSHQKKRLT